MKTKNIKNISKNKKRSITPNINKSYSEYQNSFLLKGKPIYNKWNKNNYKQKFAFNIFGKPKIEENNWNDISIIENNNDLFISNKIKRKKNNKEEEKKKEKLKIENLNYSIKGINNKIKNENNNYQIINKENEYFIQNEFPYKMREKISQSNELNLTIKSFQKSNQNLLYPIHANQLTIEKQEQILFIQKNSFLNIFSQKKNFPFQPISVNQINITGKKKPKLYLQYICKFTLNVKKEKKKFLPYRICQVYYEGIKKPKNIFKIIRNTQILINENKKKNYELIPIKTNKFDIIGKPKIIKKKKIINKIQSNIQFSIKRKHHFRNLIIRKYNNLIIKNSPKKKQKLNLKINKSQLCLYSQLKKKQNLKIIKSELNIKSKQKKKQIILKQIKNEEIKIKGIKKEAEKIYIRKEPPNWNIRNKIIQNEKVTFLKNKKNNILNIFHQNFQIFSFPKNLIISKTNDINYYPQRKKTWNELNKYVNNIKYTFSTIKKIPLLKIDKNEISFRKKSSDEEIIINDGEFSERKENLKSKIDEKKRKEIADELFKEEEPKKITISKNPENIITNFKPKKKIIKEDDFISRNINLRTVNEIQDIQCLLRRRNNPNENELLREFTQDKNPFS